MTAEHHPAVDGGDDANREPRSGEPGSHPIGTGLGVAGGFAAGAVAGSTVGPVGTLVGAVAGAVVGGLAGNGIAELIDPTAEEAYWRENYSGRPYVTGDASFDDYGPAYRYGIDSYGRFEGRTFDEAEPELMLQWPGAAGASRLSWDHAKHATRDSWQRVNETVVRAIPRESSRGTM